MRRIGRERAELDLAACWRRLASIVADDLAALDSLAREAQRRAEGAGERSLLDDADVRRLSTYAAILDRVAASGAVAEARPKSSGSLWDSVVEEIRSDPELAARVKAALG